MTLPNIWQLGQVGAQAALHKIFAGWLTRFAENLHTVCAVVVLPSKRVAVQLWWRAQTEGVQSAGRYIQFGAVVGGGDGQGAPSSCLYNCPYCNKIQHCAPRLSVHSAWLYSGDRGWGPRPQHGPTLGQQTAIICKYNLCRRKCKSKNYSNIQVKNCYFISFQ